MTSKRPTLRFLGGAGTVTGSKYWIRHRGQSLLLECGLFQGLKKLRLRNWEDPPFRCAQLAAVVISHAHIDHSGYLPRIVREGFEGPIYCTHGTGELLEILLPDAGRIQEEDAQYANRKGFSRHKLALPLFSETDAKRTLKFVRGKPYHRRIEVTPWCHVVFRPAGHIFGSATVELQIDADPPVRLVFSGDLGRWGRPITKDPELVPRADVLLLESTYGDRRHELQRTDEELAQVVRRVQRQRGVLIIPAFAVGRTQEVLWRLDRLERQGKIPSLPVYIDSPMATDVTQLYCRHPEEHDLPMQQRIADGTCPLGRDDYVFVRSRDASKALSRRKGPMIIVAASGMATGGRVLHHLEKRLPHPENVVLLVGYQASGTRGRSLLEGAETVKIHGRRIPVRASVEQLVGLSAHADQADIDRWLDGFEKPPERVFLVHGEPESARGLARHLTESRGWPVEVARDQQQIML